MKKIKFIEPTLIFLLIFNLSLFPLHFSFGAILSEQGETLIVDGNQDIPETEEAWWLRLIGYGAALIGYTMIDDMFYGSDTGGQDVADCVETYGNPLGDDFIIALWQITEQQQNADVCAYLTAWWYMNCSPVGAAGNLLICLLNQFNCGTPSCSGNEG